MERVHANSTYIYRATYMLDVVDPKSSAEPGQKVRVVKLHGCPPPNTMGHCHIEDMDGNFLGLVHVSSLHKE